MEQRLSALLREAMLILDGEAPDEVPLQGDGWSLIGPVEPKPAPAENGALHTTGHDNVVPFPVPERTQRDELRVAIHEALEGAIADGWNLVDDEEPAPTLELSAEEQAFFDAGDALTTVPAATTHADPEPEQRKPFWVRFWRKTA